MTLYPYQEEGVRFLTSTPRAYLADEMGLGKTVQALAALRRLGVTRYLVVAPARTIPNWRAEARVWHPTPEPGATLTSYSALIRHPDKLRGPWQAVVLDEAHYCKSPSAKRTKAALTLASKAGRAILLSGTPMPNDATELYTLFHYLWPDALPCKDTASAWRNRFCRWTQTKYGPRVYGHKNASELMGMLRGRMLRRKLADVALDLPPLRVTLHTLPADEAFTRGLREQAHILEAYEGEEREEEDASMSRLRRLLGTLKAPLVGDQISQELDADEYDKIVVLYHHRDVGDILYEYLYGHGVLRLDGRTTPKAAEEMERAFQTDPLQRVFLGQMTAAGVGLNLQAASEAALVEPAWTPDENRQAIKRIHRIGQDQPCRARVFGVEGTQDEAIMNTIALKSRLQETVGLR